MHDTRVPARNRVPSLDCFPRTRPSGSSRSRAAPPTLWCLSRCTTPSVRLLSCVRACFAVSHGIVWGCVGPDAASYIINQTEMTTIVVGEDKLSIVR